MLQTEEAQSGVILWWPRSKAKMYPICCRSAGQPLTAYGRTKRRTEPLDSSRPSQVPSSNKDVGPSVQTKSHLQPSQLKNSAVKSASEEIQLNARGAKGELMSVHVSNCAGLAFAFPVESQLVSGMPA